MERAGSGATVLAQALVLLSAKDADAPDLPGLCTVSKDDPGDDGGLQIGIEASEQRGALWCDRPYAVGNPSVDWMVARVARNWKAGADCTQVMNEPNLTDVEHWQGGPGAYADYHRAVADRTPGAVTLYAPMSPGVPGWEEWVALDRTAYAVHCYGGLSELRRITQWYLDNTQGELWITETNPGAGNTFDLDAWATTDLRPFLDWCSQFDRITLVAYFSHRWDQSPTLPSSIDAAGTRVETVLRTWRAPEVAMPDIVLSVPNGVALAHPDNYQTGPRPRTLGVVLHTTRGNASSQAREYAATVSWFQNPAAGVSAHLIVGPTSVTRSVHDADAAWHCRAANADHLGIEITQPKATDPISDFQYAAAAEACRKWSQVYGFPLERVMTQTRPGLVGHEDTESGRLDGKTDPGNLFRWDYFIRLCKEGTTVPDTEKQLEDIVWGLGDQLQKVGPRYDALGDPHRAAYCRTQGEALKEFVNTALKQQK